MFKKNKNKNKLPETLSLLLEEPNLQNILGHLVWWRLLMQGKRECMTNHVWKENIPDLGRSIENIKWTMNLHLLNFKKHGIGVPAEEG